MQKLPIGEQFFDRLRENNFLYVDKTEQIYKLMQVGALVFLSRPRRFGKSLLTTTLQAIYQGKRDLFQGLWIEDKVDWQPTPVILINFNDVSYRTQPLVQGLSHYLDNLARDYDLALTGNDPKEKFLELISRLSVHGKITLLIDEYDKPITDLLENAEKVQENVDTLKDFYAVLKSSAAQHLQFTFITGVSKYGKLSIFSDLNNLIDITVDARFSTLLGYTQQELEHYFADYLARLVQTFQVSHSELLRQIAYWYNGYSWDGVNRVYVPFSTMLFLEMQTFENHWFATGTPTFLIKLLRQKQVPAYALESITADTKLLNSADIHQISVVSLLFQTGYLTIKQVQRTLQGQFYELGYPNYEVAHAFQQHLLVDYLETNPDQVSAFLLMQLRQALQTTNIEAFIATLQAIFADIPSQLFLPQEAYYHSVVYLVLRLLGFTIQAERMTNVGRIDAVLELADKVYILEFKMTTGQIALDQIRSKQYAQPFLGSNKTVILVGIAFDKTTRNIADWAHEVVG